MTFNFLDPAGVAKAEQFDIAPKLESLQGKRLGLLDNSKTNAEKYLKMVGKILVDRYGVAEVKLFRKDALSKPAPAEVLDELVANRSEEHKSELQSLMRISYAVFCLKKKQNTIHC